MQRPQAIGPYQVVRELGRGAMGVVYEVRHPEIPRPLALKLQSAGGADDLLRFQREGELLARVRHANVLRVHQLAASADGCYLVTDLVEGRSLGASLRGQPLAPRRVAEVVRALADGLAAAHALGIVHRDIKPDNVILQPDGTPVLIDFGLARASESDRLTATGALVGTPAYMAPEQALGAKGDVDGRTDIYGLGGVLFVLVAGQPPFVDDALPALLMRVIEEEPAWPAGADPALVAIGRVALAKAPADRYPTALALRDDLDRYLAGEAPWALSRGAPRDLARSRRRLRPALGAAALALVLAGVAVAVRPPAFIATAGALDAQLAWERDVVAPWCLGLADDVPGPSASDLGARRAAVERIGGPEARALERRLLAYARLIDGSAARDRPRAPGALDLTVEALALRAEGAAPAARERVQRALGLQPDLVPAKLLALELEAASSPDSFLAACSAPVHARAVRLAVKAVHGRALASARGHLVVEVERLEGAVERAAALGVDLAPFAGEKRDLLRRALESRSDVALAAQAGETEVLDLLLRVARSAPAIPPDPLVEAAVAALRVALSQGRPEERDRRLLAQGARLGGWARRAGGPSSVEASEELLGDWCEVITFDLHEAPLDEPVIATEVALAYLHFGRVKPTWELLGLIKLPQALQLERCWPDSVAASFLTALAEGPSAPATAARLDALEVRLRDGPADLGPAAAPRAYVIVARHLISASQGPSDPRLSRAIEHARRSWREPQPNLWLDSASTEAAALEAQGRAEDGLARRRAVVQALRSADLGFGFFNVAEHEGKAALDLLVALRLLGRDEELVAQRGLLDLPGVDEPRRAELGVELSRAFRRLGRLDEARELLQLLERNASSREAIAVEAFRLCLDLADFTRARALLGQVGPRRAELEATLERHEARQRR